MKKTVSIIAALGIVLTARLCGCGKSSGTDYSSDYSSYDNSSYTMDHDTYCMLYMDISDVFVSHKRNYAYVTGTIKNTGDYSIKYVKVKASCKDLFGNVLDTDWTYAVDSAWLDAGESKRFEMMVRDADQKITTADVNIMYD